MEQPEGESKKLSIGEALEAMRAGRTSKGGAAHGSAAQAAAAQRPQRIPPGFWLQNLQDGIQRSRDQLYDSIANDATAQSGMRRRDLAATEMFHVPAGCLDEVISGGASTSAAGLTGLTRYQDIEVIDYSKRGSAAVETVSAIVAPPARPAPAPVAVNDFEHISMVSEVTDAGKVVQSSDNRFQSTEMLNLNLGAIEEVQQQSALPEGPKKFKVNPMIREIFQKKAEQAVEQGDVK